jgi:hypothetical protein
MFSKVLQLTGLQSQEERDAKLINDLIKREAQIGGTLFGPIPKGGRREFFCLDEHTWIWYEEWIDSKTNKRRTRTTRYDVRPDSIIKVQDGNQRIAISGDEAGRFYDAVCAYERKVKHELYQIA